MDFQHLQLLGSILNVFSFCQELVQYSFHHRYCIKIAGPNHFRIDTAKFNMLNQDTAFLLAACRSGHVHGPVE